MDNLPTINARHDGIGLTPGRLQEDVERLSENEAAFEVEAAKQYSFEEPAEALSVEN